MSGKRRTEAERAIIYAAVMGGLSNERTDQILAEVGFRPLSPASYKWILRSYVPLFLGRIERLGAAIEHPPTDAHIRETLLSSSAKDEDDL